MKSNNTFFDISFHYIQFKLLNKHAFLTILIEKENKYPTFVLDNII